MTIEDAAELRLQQPHVVRLESRPASVEGRGEVTIRDLLRNALRMRPDRIVIGEVRGAEALDLLTALNTGHDGALSTVHANSPADALRRLETLALMAGVGLPHARDRASRCSAASTSSSTWSGAPTASRRVAEIAEVSVSGVGIAAAAARRRRRRAAARSPRAEAVLASPALASWVRLALEPLRAGRARGVLCPRRSSAAGWPLLGGGGAIARRLVRRRAVGGAAAGGRRRRRSRPGRSPAAAAATARAVERSLPEVARAVADSLTAGRSLRASLAAAAGVARRAAGGRAGPARRRAGARRADRGGDRGLAARMRSARVDAFAAALLSQRLAGGDLAGLLRRFAEGAAERDRVAEDARSATAQARFTGLLVVAMPSGAALFAELLQPGFLARLAGLAARPRPARRRRLPAAGRVRRDSRLSRVAL